uniref:PX domain-containing protein n=1 Tax=Scylla olivacea TaxID=85551 RepID=A0A0P4WSJ9_SCYOL
MDTDDDISALEEEEEEVALLSHSTLSCELKLSPPEPTVSSPCNSELSCPHTQSLNTSLEEFVSCDSEDDDAPSPTPHSTRPRSFSASRKESKTVVRYMIRSARTHLTKEEKFVVYTVEVQRFVQCPDGENQMLYKPVPKCCASFTRRYSEFLAVYSALMESHRSLMEEFEGFPKKVLIGNFSKEVITERCKGLARFMNFVQEEGVLCRTAVFSKFLYHPEIIASNNHLLHSQFEEAEPILENTYVLLNNLQWDTGLMLRILCQLIVCLYALSNYERCYLFAKHALKKFQLPINRNVCKELYLPLLVFCDNLWRILGKDRNAIRKKIDLLNKQKAQEDVVPNLLDLLRDEIAIRTLH